MLISLTYPLNIVHYTISHTVQHHKLKKNKFPKLWTTGLITPIFKKGPKSLVSNYRGIMLLACLGKLFTKILNDRLLKYSIQKNIFAKEQIGQVFSKQLQRNYVISLLRETFY